MEGWEADAASGGESSGGEGKKASLESWKGEEVNGVVEGLGVVRGVEAEVELRAEVGVSALVDGDLGVGGTVDQASFDGALGFLVSMYREEGVLWVGGGGDGRRGGVALGLASESSMSLSS